MFKCILGPILGLELGLIFMSSIGPNFRPTIGPNTQTRYENVRLKR